MKQVFMDLINDIIKNITSFYYGLWRIDSSSIGIDNDLNESFDNNPFDFNSDSISWGNGDGTGLDESFDNNN